MPKVKDTPTPSFELMRSRARWFAHMGDDDQATFLTAVASRASESYEGKPVDQWKSIGQRLADPHFGSPASREMIIEIYKGIRRAEREQTR